MLFRQLSKNPLGQAALLTGLLATSAEAQSIPATATIAWDAKPANDPRCGVHVYGVNTPGVFFGPSSIVMGSGANPIPLPVMEPATTATVITNGQPAVYALAPIYPAAGKTCATTGAHEFSYTITVNGTSYGPMLSQIRAIDAQIWAGLLSGDADNDGVPNTVEVINVANGPQVKGNPNNPCTSGPCENYRYLGTTNFEVFDDGVKFALAMMWLNSFPYTPNPARNNETVLSGSDFDGEGRSNLTELNPTPNGSGSYWVPYDASRSRGFGISAFGENDSPSTKKNGPGLGVKLGHIFMRIAPAVGGFGKSGGIGPGIDLHFNRATGDYKLEKRPGYDTSYMSRMDKFGGEENLKNLQRIFGVGTSQFIVVLQDPPPAPATDSGPAADR